MAVFERIQTPDGVFVSVGEWGNPGGPAILLIHGQAQSTLSFNKQLDSYLAEQFRIVAFDLRGHGLSDKPSDPAFYQDGKRWADEIQAVIDGKKLHKPVVAGWSLGGRILRQYLVEYGDAALGGINFVSTRTLEEDSTIGPALKDHHAKRPADLAERIAANIGFLRSCYAKPLEESDFLNAVAYNFMMPLAVREAIGGWLSDPEAVRSAFRNVTAPTLITHGLNDALTLPRSAELTAAAIPHAKLSFYDGCGHAPFYEDSERYNHELAEFVWSVSESA